MTLEEYLQSPQNKPRRKPRDEEHRLQVSCIRWARYQYPHLSLLLFAVPNGGRRDAVTAAKLKAEGVVAGVADILLLVPSGRYHGLCIEMKTPKGRQSDAQKEWQEEVWRRGYKYAICRSLQDFMHEVNTYLAL